MLAKKVLLTGGTGLVGAALYQKIGRLDGYQVRCSVRRPVNHLRDAIPVGDINSTTDYTKALLGVDIVVHAAARTHVMNEYVSDPLSIYREVNVEGSVNLAKQAISQGVKRFIFISSIKVNGESTTANIPFTEEKTPAPEDAYGLSKYEAEEALKEATLGTDMELVIIRPPLVYGPGVKANFLSLLKLAKTPLPIPFGMVNNHRSMVYLANLVDFIIHCVDHPKAANQTFLISDMQDVSLKTLIRLMRGAMNKPALLIPIPVILFKVAGRLVGKTSLIDRLVGDLQVDISKAKGMLEWAPPYTVEQGIQATVDDFLSRN